jgi:multiple sugar transport system permease protein
MPIISPVGRKSWRSRIATLAIYAFLSVGALTTVYPFALMIATGFKGATDQDDHHLIPKFWSDDSALLEKYLTDKYAGNASWIASTRIGADASDAEVRRYRQFLESLHPDWWVAGFRTAANQVTSRLAVRYQDWLERKFHDIDALNRAYIEENVAFRTVTPPNELLDRAEWRPPKGQKWLDWQQFKQAMPAEFRVPIRAQRMWQEFLRSLYSNQIGQVPAEIRGSATTFETVAYPGRGELWNTFVSKRLPERMRGGNTLEEKWAKISTGPLPIVADENLRLRENGKEIRTEFTTRNYRYALDYVALHGRAMWNTFVFCALAVLTQLIVNPLAAYALSRYPIRASGKVLLFLLATMAFPAEVAMIPSFLLLKDLGLLNTFAALVLPTAASGYTIYLLKGFFDSLPQEVFESAQMDGAKEMTMFRRIALPLCAPVLGYLGLLAFMGAYGAFLYAFLVAQDQRMWTLMVWIYQLQNSAPKAVIMAALTLAAAPTLLVFLLSQRVIMRGIILPGER